MLIKVFKDPQFCFNVKDQLESKGWWSWPFLTLSDINQIKLVPCRPLPQLYAGIPSAHFSSWISIHHALPFMNGHLLLAQNFPQFCCLGGHHFGKDPHCSSCLLQVISPSFSQLISGLAVFWLSILQDVNPDFLTVPWTVVMDIEDIQGEAVRLGQGMSNEFGIWHGLSHSPMAHLFRYAPSVFRKGEAKLITKSLEVEVKMGTVKFIWKASMFKLESLHSIKLTDFALG